MKSNNHVTFYSSFVSQVFVIGTTWESYNRMLSLKIFQILLVLWNYVCLYFYSNKYYNTLWHWFIYVERWRLKYPLTLVPHGNIPTKLNLWWALCKRSVLATFLNFNFSPQETRIKILIKDAFFGNISSKILMFYIKI